MKRILDVCKGNFSMKPVQDIVKLRLRGKGIPARRNAEAGDQYVTLRIVLSNPNDPKLSAFLEEWKAASAEND